MNTLGRRKQYVEVLAIHAIDGSTHPQKITLADGACFDIDEVKNVCHPMTLKIGEAAIRYTIKIGTNETFLYNDADRWYVEMKEPN